MKKNKKYLILLFMFLFIGITKVNAYEVTSCGSVDNIPTVLPTVTRNSINVVKIIVPVIIIVLGLLDFAKAVMSSDEKNMKEYSNKFIRRIIAGVFIFFVVAIVQFVFKNIDENKQNILTCMSCFISDKASCGEKTISNSSSTSSEDKKNFTTTQTKCEDIRIKSETDGSGISKCKNFSDKCRPMKENNVWICKTKTNTDSTNNELIPQSTTNSSSTNQGTSKSSAISNSSSTSSEDKKIFTKTQKKCEDIRIKSETDKAGISKCKTFSDKCRPMKENNVLICKTTQVK